MQDVFCTVTELSGPTRARIFSDHILTFPWLHCEIVLKVFNRLTIEIFLLAPQTALLLHCLNNSSDTYNPVS